LSMSITSASVAAGSPHPRVRSNRCCMWRRSGRGGSGIASGQSAACRASVVDRGAAAYGRRSSSEERREAAVADGEPLKKVMDRSVGHVNGHVDRGCRGTRPARPGRKSVPVPAPILLNAHRVCARMADSEPTCTRGS
jgi:hypothetical protein